MKNRAFVIYDTVRELYYEHYCVEARFPGEYTDELHEQLGHATFYASKGDAQNQIDELLDSFTENFVILPVGVISTKEEHD